MIGPCHSCSTCTQALLQLPVQPLRHTVALRVESSGGHVLNPQRLAHGLPYRTGELCATVGRNSMWDAKTCHSTRCESVSTLPSCDALQRKNLWPPGSPVYSRHQVHVAVFRSGQRAHQIHVHVLQEWRGLIIYLGCCLALGPRPKRMPPFLRRRQSTAAL